VDGIERVRIAGTIVDLLRSFGYTANDIGAIADAIHRHLAVQESHETHAENGLKLALIITKN